MTYAEAMELIDYLNERFRQAGMHPWYKWAVDITWDKLEKWHRILEGAQCQTKK